MLAAGVSGHAPGLSPGKAAARAMARSRSWTVLVEAQPSAVAPRAPVLVPGGTAVDIEVRAAPRVVGALPVGYRPRGPPAADQPSSTERV